MNQLLNDVSVQGAGRLAVVTGATGVLGPAICQVLMREGWQVAACDRMETDFEFVEKVTGQPVVATRTFAADLADAGQASSLIGRIEAQMGPVHLLVNNATANPGNKLLEDSDSAYAHRMMQINLDSPLQLIRTAANSLAATKGSVVNVSSVQTIATLPGNTVYAMLKAGMERMTQTLAAELSPRGVRINTVRVGSVTGYAFMRHVLEKLTTEQARALYQHVMEKHAQNKSTALLPFHGQAEDIGHAIAFLGSEKARFITAATLPVDGGLAHLPLQLGGPDRKWILRDVLSQWLSDQGIEFNEVKK